jgi:plasmid stabilization system protein ParE
MGTHKVNVTTRARDDLRSTVIFVAKQSSPEIAERFGAALLDKALSLENLPERGRVLPELKNPFVREIFFKSYRIVYRLHGSTVEVIRFWHAARGTPEIDSDEFRQI